MTQQGLKGVTSLVCYTVDSDEDTDDEEMLGVSNDFKVKEEPIDEEDPKEPTEEGIEGETEKEDNVVQCDDRAESFNDLCIKKEPLWSIDTDGYKDPQDEVVVVEFLEHQVKVEIVSESEESSSEDDSSDDEEVPKEKVVEVEKDEGPPKTKNELGMSDLPPVEELDLKVHRNDCLVIGLITSTVDELVVIESIPDKPALDLESVLFYQSSGDNENLFALGRVFDVIGPVTRPYYCVRFNNSEHVQSKNLSNGQEIFFAPKTEHTSFIFLEQLMKMKISDASWCNDEEAPPDFQEYSDDEQEKEAKQNKKIAKMVQKGVDPAAITAKRARMEQGKARQEQRRSQGQHSQPVNPRINNGLYTPQVNPFYRQQRNYDPRAMGGGIRWGDYQNSPQTFGSHHQQQQQHHRQHTMYMSERPPLHPVHQYHQSNTSSYNNFSVPPPPLHASSQQMHSNLPPAAQAALQGGSWGSQYQSTPVNALRAPLMNRTVPPPPPPGSSPLP